MKPLVLDTNVLINFCQRPDAFKRTEIASCQLLLVTATVAGEFLAGVNDTRRGKESLQRFQELLAYPTVSRKPVTDITADYYAKVFQALKARGQPIPQNDMWIAASALEHGADIVTYDPHFRLVPMLTVIIPE